MSVFEHMPVCMHLWPGVVCVQLVNIALLYGLCLSSALPSGFLPTPKPVASIREGHEEGN